MIPCTKYRHTIRGDCLYRARQYSFAEPARQRHVLIPLLREIALGKIIKDVGGLFADFCIHRRAKRAVTQCLGSGRRYGPLVCSGAGKHILHSRRKIGDYSP